ncbi:MAG: N-acetylmuramoyl-L-alanine amidase-like domain-containing protein [Thermoanaerobaculia bacterium]
MKTTRPRGLDPRRARSLLAGAKPHRTVLARIEALSAALLGAPYVAHGLVGSATEPEELVARIDGFDCVTYVESVIALARAADPAGFVEELRALRYDGGAVEWRKRNHYMTEWVRRNARAGAVRPIAPGPLGKRAEKTLSAVPGLPPKRARLAIVPKGLLRAFLPRLANGDVLLFASTKAGLDVFHCGFLVLAGGSIRLRHASRSAGRVVEEDLARFLAANRMAGVIAARPLDVPPAGSGAATPARGGGSRKERA